MYLILCYVMAIFLILRILLRKERVYSECLLGLESGIPRSSSTGMRGASPEYQFVRRVSCRFLTTCVVRKDNRVNL